MLLLKITDNKQNLRHFIAVSNTMKNRRLKDVIGLTGLRLNINDQEIASRQQVLIP